MPIEPTKNPLLFDDDAKMVDVEDLAAPTVLTRPKRNVPRELLDLRRKQTAKEALAGLTLDNELYGFTKGQFSMLDMLEACLEKTGPAFMSISTWTASTKEILGIETLFKAGTLTGTRWLIDRSMVQRKGGEAFQIRKAFGNEAVRVANVHAKFCLFINEKWQLVIRTSCNLNMNPRAEDFTIANDPELATFIGKILDELWSKQKKTLGLTPTSRKMIEDHM